MVDARGDGRKSKFSNFEDAQENSKISTRREARQKHGWRARVTRKLVASYFVVVHCMVASISHHSALIPLRLLLTPLFTGGTDLVKERERVAIMEHEDVDMAEVDDGDASSYQSSNDHTIEQQHDDDDEEVEVAEVEERLTWRDDPEDSLSDWTIEITVDGKIYGCYHVHRAILAVGAKKSSYFASLFKNNKANYVESETNTSRIELEILAAQAFPAMLDFMYSSWNPKGDRDFSFTSKNVASLHHLGMYFGIESLCSKAQEFTRDALPFGECWTCYDHAKHFGDEMMAKIVVELCCDSIRRKLFFGVNAFSSLIQESDERLWLDIVEHEDAPSFHHNLSILIARFCCSHLDRISVDVFLKLSSEKYHSCDRIGVRSAADGARAKHITPDAMM